MPRDDGIDVFLVSLKNAADPNRYFWFGLHDEGQEGKWEWIDGSDLGTGYSRWDDGVSVKNQGKKDCALYWNNGVEEWVAWYCEWKNLFICQVLPPAATDK
ncbi:hepatic lectin-like [Branchiostoma floridae x Branchiostoma japonicum]